MAEIKIYQFNILDVKENYNDHDIGFVEVVLLSDHQREIIDVRDDMNLLWKQKIKDLIDELIIDQNSTLEIDSVKGQRNAINKLRKIL